MIGLLVSAATAQTSAFSAEGTDCPNGRPVVGTAGFGAFLSAYGTNQTTYSATAFAKKVLDRRVGRREEGVRVDAHWRHVQTYGLTRLQVYHDRAGEPAETTFIDETPCAARYEVASRPVDAWASNVGLSVTGGRFTAFYAGAVTYTYPVAGDQWTRISGTTTLVPFYVAGAALGAPLLDLATRNPFLTDWIGGVNADLELVDLSAGYAASRGGYFRVAERTVGLFATATISPSAEYGYVALGGLDRLSFGEALEAVGLTTAAFLDRPALAATFGTPPTTVDLPAARAASVPQVRWRTARLAQQNLGLVADVDAEYRVSPDPALQRLLLGLHTPRFHPSRVPLEDEDEFTPDALLQLGVVDVPTHHALGVSGGMRPSARLSVGGRLELDGQHVGARLNVMLNDPEQLELFPYDTQILAWSLQVQGGL